MSIIVTIMLMFTSMKMKPTEAHSSLIQKGKASFYSKRLHGKRTTSGERHLSNQLTAAHPSLPMNTLVEVTNLENNQSVVVRINDRGPHRKGRIIDLTYRAAKTIGMVSTGIANVAVRVVSQKRAMSLPATVALAPTEPEVVLPADNI